MCVRDPAICLSSLTGLRAGDIAMHNQHDGPQMVGEAGAGPVTSMRKLRLLCDILRGPYVVYPKTIIAPVDNDLFNFRLVLEMKINQTVLEYNTCVIVNAPVAPLRVLWDLHSDRAEMRESIAR